MTFLTDIKEMPVGPGEAVMWWLGQMGMMIKIGGTVLCVDYYAAPSPARQVPPPLPAGEMEGVDAFLGTHNHSDHMDHVSWKIFSKNLPGAWFVFPAMHEKSVREDGVQAEKCLGLNEGGHVKIGEVEVHAIAAAHEFLDRDPVTGLYPCLQYIIEGNGVRIYHAGDTLRYEGMMDKLRSFGHLDAAVLPINGRDGKRYRRNCIGNMTFQEAADLAGELCPGVVVPGHWDMFADNSGDPEAFADYLDAKYPGRTLCRVPDYMVPIHVGRGPAGIR